MVDFFEMTKRLKAWKIRKQKIRCRCMAEVATTCYEFEQNIYDNRRNVECKCACHKEE